jgi:hypothetical protein
MRGGYFVAGNRAADNRVAVSDAIKVRLDVLEMSSIQLIEQSEVSSATIRQILNHPEKHRPSRQTLKAISLTLGWPANYLYNVLNAPLQGTVDQAAESGATQLSVIESRLAKVERHQRNIIVVLGQQFGKSVVDAIYGPEVPLPNEATHDRSDP